MSMQQKNLFDVFSEDEEAFLVTLANKLDN